MKNELIKRKNVIIPNKYAIKEISNARDLGNILSTSEIETKENSSK